MEYSSDTFSLREGLRHFYMLNLEFITGIALLPTKDIFRPAFANVVYKISLKISKTVWATLFVSIDQMGKFDVR
jgi:hypothetical protein